MSAALALQECVSAALALQESGPPVSEEGEGSGLSPAVVWSF